VRPRAGGLFTLGRSQGAQVNLKLDEGEAGDTTPLSRRRCAFIYIYRHARNSGTCCLRLCSYRPYRCVGLRSSVGGCCVSCRRDGRRSGSYLPADSASDAQVDGSTIGKTPVKPRSAQKIFEPEHRKTIIAELLKSRQRTPVRQRQCGTRQSRTGMRRSLKIKRRHTFTFIRRKRRKRQNTRMSAWPPASIRTKKNRWMCLGCERGRAIRKKKTEGRRCKRTRTPAASGLIKRSEIWFRRSEHGGYVR
jgi:hypothetical protein